MRWFFRAACLVAALVVVGLTPGALDPGGILSPGGVVSSATATHLLGEVDPGVVAPAGAIGREVTDDPAAGVDTPDEAYWPGTRGGSAVGTDGSGAFQTDTTDGALALSLASPGTGIQPPAIANRTTAVVANAARSTDLAVRPTAAGTDFYLQIRSADAPAHISFQVNLSEDQSLVPLKDGSIAVVDSQIVPNNAGAGLLASAEQQTNGQAVAVIKAPVGRDMSGQRVPIGLSASGNTITISPSSAPPPLEVGLEVTSDRTVPGVARAASNRTPIRGLSFPDGSTDCALNLGCNATNANLAYTANPQPAWMTQLVGAQNMKLLRYGVAWDAADHCTQPPGDTKSPAYLDPQADCDGLKEFLGMANAVRAANGGANWPGQLEITLGHDWVGGTPAPANVAQYQTELEHLVTYVNQTLASQPGGMHVRYWGAWNEPDLMGPGGGSLGTTSVSGAATLAAGLWVSAHNLIEAGSYGGCDQNCKVIAGTFASPWSDRPTGYHGGNGFFDDYLAGLAGYAPQIWAYHSYWDFIGRSAHSQPPYAGSIRMLDARYMQAKLGTPRWRPGSIFMDEGAAAQYFGNQVTHVSGNGSAAQRQVGAAIGRFDALGTGEFAKISRALYYEISAGGGPGHDSGLFEGVDKAVSAKQPEVRARYAYCVLSNIAIGNCAGNDKADTSP